MSDRIAELETRLREAEAKSRTAEQHAMASKDGKVKTAIWAGIAGFLLFAIGGQWFPGYQLDSSAEESSRQAASAAVSEVMAELCAERFAREPGFETRLEALHKETGDWSQADHIRKGNWASAPNGDEADHATAERCRELIAERQANGSAKKS